MLLSSSVGSPEDGPLALIRECTQYTHDHLTAKMAEQEAEELVAKAEKKLKVGARVQC